MSITTGIQLSPANPLRSFLHSSAFTDTRCPSSKITKREKKRRKERKKGKKGGRKDNRIQINGEVDTELSWLQRILIKSDYCSYDALLSISRTHFLPCLLCYAQINKIQLLKLFSYLFHLAEPSGITLCMYVGLIYFYSFSSYL